MAAAYVHDTARFGEPVEANLFAIRSRNGGEYRREDNALRDVEFHEARRLPPMLAPSESFSTTAAPCPRRCQATTEPYDAVGVAATRENFASVRAR